MDTAIILGGLRLEMRMVTHFLLSQQEGCFSTSHDSRGRKWVTILISNLRPPNIMAVSMEGMHEGLRTSPNSPSHAHFMPWYRCIHTKSAEIAILVSL